jgi:hypothetical protein
MEPYNYGSLGIKQAASFIQSADYKFLGTNILELHVETFEKYKE